MSQAASIRRIRTADIVLVAFLATVTMLFAGFTSAVLIRRAGTDWASIELPGLVWVSTTVLMVSSAALELACRRKSRGGVLVALALGVAFVACQLVAWRQLASGGLGLGSTPHASFFYTLSAVHGLHVLGGLGALLYVSVRRAAWRTAALYWHFMGVVWIYVLVLLLTL